MVRLPVPGSDNNIWGSLLNEYLGVEHNKDGSLKASGSLGSRLRPRGDWASLTAYSVNDVVLRDKASFVCTKAHTSSTSAYGNKTAFQNDLASGKWAAQGPRQQWYDIRDYGAIMDGAANDTAAVQAAIDAASAAGGGFVFVPAGLLLVTTIVLKNHVNLVGAGHWATIIKSLSNTNAPVITNFVSPDGIQANAEFVSIRDLKIDGHLAGSSSGAGNTSPDAHGIYFNTNPANTKATNDDMFDTHQLVQNVYLHNCAGWGFSASGRSHMRLINVYAENCNMGGFNPTYDTFLLACDAGANQGPGFYFSHGDILAVNCKSFLAGKPPYNKGGVTNNQPGFLVDTTTAFGLNMVGCTAQQNNGQGFLLRNTQGIIMSGCSSLSNNFWNINAPEDFAGVEIQNSRGCRISFVSSAGTSGSTEYYGLRTSSGSDGNDITLTTGFTGTSGALTSDSTLLSNRVYANGLPLNPSLNKLAGLSDVNAATPGDGQVIAWSASTNKWIATSAPSGGFTGGLLGSGVDGAAVLDGSTSIGWASLSGGIYTMTRDCNLTDLTINPGVTLITTGFRVFCRGTGANNGTIADNGASASSYAGAGAATSRTLGSGRSGGAGNVGTGSTGTAGSVCVGAGGSGGNGTGANTGGASASPTSTFSYVLQNPQPFLTGSVAYATNLLPLTGGSGGSGGGGDDSNRGGGGGAGGGIVFIIARAFINNGTITANGGNGFAPTTGNCGGGGGGGGGLIALFSINDYTGSGTTQAGGGAGASGVGTGTAGGNGGNGVVLKITLQ